MMKDIEFLVSKLFGFTDDPDGFKTDGKPLFYVKSGRVLIGEARQPVKEIDETNKKLKYIHMYRTFEPDENLVDAFMTIRGMMFLGWHYESGDVIDSEGGYYASFMRGSYQNGHFEYEYAERGDSPAVAICKAAVSALKQWENER